MLFESQPRGNSHAVPRREQDAVESGASVQHKQTPNTQKGLQHVAIKAQVDKSNRAHDG